MSRRRDTSSALLLTLVLAAAPACSRDGSRASAWIEVGHHRVRLAVPEGWEHLDHGRQHLFRSGETQLSLVDLGPATREGITRELRAAEELWRAGRWQDAYARVHTLNSPMLRYASSDQRLEFYREWHNATYVPSAADSSAIGVAFEALIEGTQELPELDAAHLLQYALERSADMQRREIARKERRTIHGAEWTAVETWDRVSHLYRSRLALVERDGYLLVLATDRGLDEQAGSAFEALLASIVIAHEPAP